MMQLLWIMNYFLNKTDAETWVADLNKSAASQGKSAQEHPFAGAQLHSVNFRENYTF